MKKFCTLLAGVLLAAGFCGCGAAPQDGPSESAAASSSQAASAPTATPIPSPTATPVPSAPAATRAPETTPPPVESRWSAAEQENWETQAYFLTGQLVDYCLQPFDETAGVEALDDGEILNFLWTMGQNSKSPEYPYRAAVTTTFGDGEGIIDHVPEQTARAVVYQLFGVEDWSYDDPAWYDSTVPEYYFDVSQALPTAHYYCQDPVGEMAGDTVTVSFRLNSEQLIVDTAGQHRKDFGPYQAVYTVLTEGGQSFLRFQGMTPVSE